MSDDRDFEKYDHSRAIRQQIRYVNDKIGEVGVENENFEKYFNKVLMALSSLDAMADPVKDEEYEEMVEEALNQGKPANMNRLEKLEFIHSSLTELMQLFYRENMFYLERRGRRTT